MGWLDYHLHEFEILNLSTGSKVNQKIADYFSMENPSADYIYDFGDYWHHEIQLEKILPREKNVNYPVCIKGKRACPPEDCGGVGGYEDLLKIIKNQISHEPCGHEAFRISDWSSSFLAHMPRGKALLHTEQK